MFKMPELLVFLLLDLLFLLSSGQWIETVTDATIIDGSTNATIGQNNSVLATENIPDLEVKCNPKTMDIIIPIERVRSTKGDVLSPSKIFFRTDASKDCQSKKENSEYFRISANLQQKACGSLVKRKKYQTEYKNEVVILDIDIGRIRSLFNFTCVYQDEDHIVVLPTSSSESSIALENDVKGKMKMTLHRDKSYSAESRINQNMPEISVGHFVFVSIDFTPSNEESALRYHTISNNCFASYFPKFDDRKMAHHFIIDGCASQFDSTVALQSNGDGWRSRWKYQMFKWVNTTSQRIYLFCDVKLCDERNLDDGHVCNKINSKKNCFGFTYGGRNRREIRSSSQNKSIDESKYVLSIGPIFPKDSVYVLDNSDGINGDNGIGEDTEGEADIVPVAVGVIIGVCVIILLVTALLFWRRRVTREKVEKENSRKEIKQGFAFMMKSSNDPEIFHQQKESKGTIVSVSDCKRDSFHLDFDQVIESEDTTEQSRNVFGDNKSRNVKQDGHCRRSSTNNTEMRSRDISRKRKRKTKTKRSNSTDVPRSTSQNDSIRGERSKRNNYRRHSNQENRNYNVKYT